MGRDRYPKQSLGALHGRIKQVCLLPSTPNREADRVIAVAYTDGGSRWNWL